jgi:hypothetical protein
MSDDINMVSTTYTDVTIRVRMRASFANNGNDDVVESGFLSGNLKLKQKVHQWLTNPDHWSIMLTPESHGPTHGLVYLCENTIIDEIDVQVTRVVDEHPMLFQSRLDNEGEDIV